MPFFAVADGEYLSLASVVGNGDAEFFMREALNGDIEVGAERADVVQTGEIPSGRELRRHVEGMHSCRPDAEKPFCYDAAVQAALSRQMALAAFGPCLDRIGYMIAKKAATRIVGEPRQHFVGIAGVECPAEGVESGAVPEYRGTLAG